MSEPMTVFPFKPRDWAVDQGDRVAQVKGVYEGEPGEVLLDLVIYSRTGDRVGRESPACGGPRSFEPACSAEGWTRIAEPSFPIRLQWVDQGDGSRVARFWAGEALPPANWKKPARRARIATRLLEDIRLRRALEQIADGHNDARRLAEKTLGRRR